MKKKIWITIKEIKVTIISDKGCHLRRFKSITEMVKFFQKAIKDKRIREKK